MSVYPRVLTRICGSDINCVHDLDCLLFYPHRLIVSTFYVLFYLPLLFPFAPPAMAAPTAAPPPIPAMDDTLGALAIGSKHSTSIRYLDAH
jgi:hypothetical protein